MDLTRQAKRSRPCDSCRKRKSRCVTEADESLCVLCKFHGLAECTYSEQPQPRKRRSSRDGEVATAGSPAKRTRFLNVGTGVEEYDALPGPSLLKRTLGLQNLHHTQYIGLHDIPDANATNTTNATARKGKSDDHDIVVRWVHPSHAFRVIPDSTTEGHAQEQDLIEAIQATVDGHGPQLVHLYFRIVHPSYPILHREVFLEKYARSYREFSPPLLAAVYLLACGYWSFSETLADFDKPDLTRLRDLAFEALQSTTRRPKISTVQASLLLAQYEGLTDRMCWLNGQQSKLAARLVSLAHGLGLHLNALQWEIPDWEIGLRRRIGWAVYMQDKWTALLHGRPSLINSDDWGVPPLTPNDFPETTENELEGSTDVEKSRLVFMQMASLTNILSEILVHIFSTRAQQELESLDDKISMLLTRIKPWQLHLKAWSSALPDSLRMDTASSMKLSPVGYLRLAYLAIEVSIHRHIIQTISADPQMNVNLVQVCRSAARERFVNAVEFFQRLQAPQIASFWYYISPKCCAMIYRFGQSLAATALDDSEKMFYDQKVKEFRWTMKVNSEAGTGFMKQAIGMLDISIRIVPGNSGSLSSNTSPSASTQVGTTPLDYANDMPVPPIMLDNFPNGAGFPGDYLLGQSLDGSDFKGIHVDPYFYHDDDYGLLGT